MQTVGDLNSSTCLQGQRKVFVFLACFEGWQLKRGQFLAFEMSSHLHVASAEAGEKCVEILEYVI